MNSISVLRIGGVICALLALLLFFLASLTRWPTIRPYIQTLGKRESPPLETLRIVSWTRRMYGKQSRPWFPEGDEAFKKCDLPKGAACEYYYNKSLAATSDVLLFKGNDVTNANKPSIKGENQTWVFWARESPQNNPGYKKWVGLTHLFDFAVTYSTLTDLTEPYGYCVKRQREEPERNYAANKTGKVLWIVSHCRAPSQRQLYVNELKKHISVDIYGKCGTKSCLPWLSPDCLENLLRKKYKFYLAFENSLCKDYITEKFWNSLEYGCLPIVLGSGDYSKHAPTNSFIDVRDFRSPKHLAEYLITVDGNDTLYNEHFSWKRTLDCGNSDYTQFPCRLCNFLHERKRGHHPELDKRPKDYLKKLWNNGTVCESAGTFRKKCNCWP